MLFGGKWAFLRSLALNLKSVGTILQKPESWGTSAVGHTWSTEVNESRQSTHVHTRQPLPHKQLGSHWGKFLDSSRRRRCDLRFGEVQSRRKVGRFRKRAPISDTHCDNRAARISSISHPHSTFITLLWCACMDLVRLRRGLRGLDL